MVASEKISVNEHLKGITIPPRPQIIADLMVAQVDPSCEVEDISDIVEKDVGLSGSILKIVNSPYFGLKNTISSIQQAVSLLGVENVVNIANGLALRKSLEHESIRLLEDFWEVSNKTACIAASLSKKIGISSSDQAYCLGLFHNCGIALMHLKYDNYFSVLSEAYSLPDGRLIDTENKHFDTNHAVIGLYVAKAWKLEPLLSEIIADHHSLEKYFGDTNESKLHKELMALLKISEYLAKTYEVLGNCQQDLEWEKYGTAILEYVGLSEDDFHEIKTEIDGY